MICGDGASQAQYARACAIAQEQIKLQRVDPAYVAIIERATNVTRGEANQRRAKLDVAARRETGAGAPPRAILNELEAPRLALPQLIRLDRYMQRALSRRRQAMRAFAAASVFRGADTSKPARPERGG